MQSKIKRSLLMAAIMACSISGAAAKADDPASPSRILVNGESPEIFYSRFLLKTEGQCSDQSMYFKFASSYSILNKIGVNSAGQDILVDLHLYLVSSSEYVALYEEHDVLNYTELGYTWRVERASTLRGTYRIQDDKLVINGLGVATGLQYNNRAAIELEMSNDVVTPGFKGMKMLMIGASSSYMPVPELDPCQR